MPYGHLPSKACSFLKKFVTTLVIAEIFHDQQRLCGDVACIRDGVLDVDSIPGGLTVAHQLVVVGSLHIETAAEYRQMLACAALVTVGRKNAAQFDC